MRQRDKRRYKTRDKRIYIRQRDKRRYIRQRDKRRYDKREDKTKCKASIKRR